MKIFIPSAKSLSDTIWTIIFDHKSLDEADVRKQYARTPESLVGIEY